MTKLLKTLFAFLLFTGVAFAKDLTFQSGDWRITLTDTLCKNGVVLQLADMIGLPDEYKKNLMTGSLTGPGDKTFDMCYIVDPENVNQLFVIAETGDMGILDIDPKKPAGI